MDVEKVRLILDWLGDIINDVHDCQCSILKCEMMSAFNTSNTVLSELKKVYDHLYDAARIEEPVEVTS